MIFLNTRQGFIMKYNQILKMLPFCHCNSTFRVLVLFLKSQKKTVSLNKVFVLISFGRHHFLSVKYTKKWLALSKLSISTTGLS